MCKNGEREEGQNRAQRCLQGEIKNKSKKRDKEKTKETVRSVWVRMIRKKRHIKGQRGVSIAKEENRGTKRRPKRL